MRLTDIYARPRPLTLAGVAHLGLPLRVRDLVDLECLSMLAQPEPLAFLPESTEATDDVKRAYRAALDTAEAASGWGGPDCDRMAFASVGGRAQMLTAVLRLETLTEAEALEIAPHVTADEWTAFDRVAFQIDPQAELVRRADTLLGITPWGGQPVTWAQAIAEVCEQLGKTPDQIAEMTVGAVRAVRCGGKSDPWKCGGTEEDEQRWAAEVGEKRWAFWSEPIAEADAATPEETTQSG